MITLQTELSRIHGLGPPFIERLGRLGIRTVRDLLWHFPARYEDFSRVVPIAELTPGAAVTVRGVVRRVEARRTWRRRMALVEAVVRDESGSVRAVWFNQPYVARALRPGLLVNLAGRVSAGEDAPYLSNPTYEPARPGGVARHTAGLIPIYPETRGLTSKGIRYLVRPLLEVVPRIADFIPADVLRGEGLPELGLALRAIHFPRTLAEAERAKRRFAFQDLFLLQLRHLKIRAALARERATPLVAREEDLAHIRRAIPFALTPAQERSLTEILADVRRGEPMNRLLQGDVGSGKTVIAVIAALVAARAGRQAAMMAPTEVLARQHHETIARVFTPLLREWGIAVGLLLSATPAAEKRRTARALADGSVQIAVGTHALIERHVAFRDLALVVIDEQHRFGVDQRAKLARRKVDGAAGEAPRILPHFLSMSATPIPRTLSLTLFGDLDLSVVDELPAGRMPIITRVVPPEARSRAYEFVRREARRGRQAFVICPRIQKSDIGDQISDLEDQASEGDALSVSEIQDPISEIRPPTSDLRNLKSGWDDVRAVKEEHERLSREVFPELTLAVLHGRMKSREKETTMREFSEGKIHVLVSTSVVEVGVDVPNATVMLIEGADRFGLAQLYQFRGRIGRGSEQSYCLLFTDATGEAARARLTALISAKSGFELAEKDLALRGPGEFLGEKQTGIPDIAMRALSDIPLIRASREAARRVLRQDPMLARSPLLAERLSAFERTLHLE